MQSPSVGFLLVVGLVLSVGVSADQRFPSGTTRVNYFKGTTSAGIASATGKNANAGSISISKDTRRGQFSGTAAAASADFGTASAATESSAGTSVQIKTTGGRNLLRFPSSTTKVNYFQGTTSDGAASATGKNVKAGSISVSKDTRRGQFSSTAAAASADFGTASAATESSAGTSVQIKTTGGRNLLGTRTNFYYNSGTTTSGISTAQGKNVNADSGSLSVLNQRGSASATFATASASRGSAAAATSGSAGTTILFKSRN